MPQLVVHRADQVVRQVAGHFLSGGGHAHRPLLQGGEQVGPEAHQALAAKGFEALLLEQGFTAVSVPEGLVVMGGPQAQGQAPLHGGIGGVAGGIAQAGGTEQATHMHG